jgi:hypothetical protein
VTATVARTAEAATTLIPVTAKKRIEYK